MSNGSLTRSRNNKVLAGVCGGLAEFTGWDAGLLRAIAAVAALFTFGTVLLVYVVLWIVLPEAGSSNSGLDHIISSFNRQEPDQR
ncbi:MAG: PspC domain-containing protein [Propionibacteriaceae bacterium]|jgi:phage shock protein PspC (stress-responsive transcriptional regulator)|nr:PspC domain-containing protein [Propionibacteriaceae bacterium]